MLELGTFGSVRGVPGNGYAYRNPRSGRSRRVSPLYPSARALGQRVPLSRERQVQRLVRARAAHARSETTLPTLRKTSR